LSAAGKFSGRGTGEQGEGKSMNRGPIWVLFFFSLDSKVRYNISFIGLGC